MSSEVCPDRITGYTPSQCHFGSSRIRFFFLRGCVSQFSNLSSKWGGVEAHVEVEVGSTKLKSSKNQTTPAHHRRMNRPLRRGCLDLLKWTSSWFFEAEELSPVQPITWVPSGGQKHKRHQFFKSQRQVFVFLGTTRSWRRTDISCLMCLAHAINCMQWQTSTRQKRGNEHHNMNTCTGSSSVLDDGLK